MAEVSVKISADTTALTAKLAVAKAELSNTTSELRQLAQEANSAGASASDELRAGLAQAAQAAAAARVEVQELNAQLRHTAETTGGLKDIVAFGDSGVHFRLREIAESFSAIGVALIAGFAGKEMIDAVERTAELGAGLLQLSSETGVSVETLSGWRYGAEQVDVSATSLDTSIKRLGRSIQESLRVPTSNAGEAFRAMGISQEFLKENSNNLQAVLLKMADAFHDHADGATADAIAQASLGRGGVELIAWLRQGSVAITEQIEKQKELGSQMTGPMAEAMEKHRQGVKDMQQAWDGLLIRLTDAVLPALNALANITKGVMDAWTGNDSGASGRYTMKPGDEQQFLGKEITSTPPPKPAFPDLGGQQKEQKDYYAQWKEQLDQQLIDLQLFGQQAKDYELTYWQGKLTVAKDGGKNYVGAAREITSQVYQLESEEHRQEEEDAKRLAEAKIQSTNQFYQAFKENIEEQRTAAAGNIAEQIRLDQVLVDEAKALYGEDTKNFLEAQRQKLEDMKRQIDAEMEPYKKLTTTIGNSFNQMFDGLITGSKTFGQAMRDLALSLIEDFARMAIKAAEDWVLSQIRQVLVTEQSEAQKTAAVAAGAQAQNAARQAAEAEGKAADAAASSASIFNDAHKAFTGAYAAVAGIPIIGPVLAPIAGATAFAAVMAMDVLSAEGGMDVGAGVNPITQLHEKEMVLPAGLSDRIRSMTEPGGGRGSPTVHFHANFIDTRDLLGRMGEVRREIAGMVADTFDSNPSLRPSY